jgi:hypothetical protein
MSRNKIDACMFCGNLPCTCLGKQPAKKAAPRKRAVKVDKAEAPVVQTKADPLAAMRAAASQVPDKPVVEPKVRVQDDPEFGSAVIALESILHPEERTRYAEFLTPELKAAAWRSRNKRG